VTESRVVAVGAPQSFRHQVARALSVDAASIEWMPTVTAVEESLGTNGRVDVVVLSPGIKEPDAFGLAEFVTRSAPATAVVMVRDRPMNGLLPAAMRAGVRDVVDLSQGGQELSEALEHAIAWSASLRIAGTDAPADSGADTGVMYSVFSSKGGTGKSFLSSNLAAALSAKTGLRTALVDLDLEMGDAFSYFGKDAAASLHDLAAIPTALDEAVLLSNATDLGFNVWGFSAAGEPGVKPIPGESIGRILRALRSTFGATVVDCPASYADHALAALDLSEVVWLVATLDVVGVRHLTIALDTLVTLGLPRERMRVVMNRGDSKVGLSLDDVKRVTGLEVDSIVPSSRLVPTSLNRGEPVYVSDPKSSVAKSVDDMAARLLALKEAGVSPAAKPKRRRFSKK
jgi:pilus assembly protein CpaE